MRPRWAGRAAARARTRCRRPPGASTHTRPPCAPAISRPMASPIPLPPARARARRRGRSGRRCARAARAARRARRRRPDADLGRPRPGRDPHDRARRAVLDRVVDQVADRLLQAVAVAGDRPRAAGVERAACCRAASGQRRPSAAPRRARSRRSAAGERRSRRPSSAPASVRRSSTVRLIRSTSSRALSSTGARRRVELVGAQADVELGAHRRQRGAQLVRGVGDEAALLLDAVLDAVEHGVEGRGEVGDLVAGAAGRRGARPRRSTPMSPRRASSCRSIGRSARRASHQPPSAVASSAAGPAISSRTRTRCDRAVDAGQRLRGDGHRGPAAARGRPRDDPEARRWPRPSVDGAAPRRPPRSAAAASARPSIGALDDRVAVGDQHAAPGSRICAAGRSPLSTVAATSRASAAPSRGSRARSARSRAPTSRVDLGGEVGAQPHDQEGADARARRPRAARRTTRSSARGSAASRLGLQRRSRRRGSCG